MADDPPTQQPPPTSTINTTAPSDNQFQLEAKVEDAETRAAREELKHTVISDKPTDPADDMQLRSGNAYNEAAETRAKTPDLRPPEADDTSKKPSSPGKKKRAHDEVEPNGKEDGNTSTTRTSSGADSDSWVVVDDAGTIGGDEKRQHRSEPQKKRARDETSPPADIHKGTGAATASLDSSATDEATSSDAQQPQTSAKAFAASGFSKLATSSASPFAAAGAGKSVFGGGAASAPSPFASLGAASPSKSTAAAPSPSKPTLAFGGTEGAPSPFARMNGSAAPSAFGGGGFGGGSPFGSALGGSRISNFASAAPPPLKSDKPAKPFGAPDSDAEDDEDGGSDSDEEASAADVEKKEDKEDAASRGDESTPVTTGDDEKKKYRKVFVDDGEAGEATLVQVRARMYYLDKLTNAEGKEEIAWRERGAGMLKINVPVDTVRIDRESGAADPKSFDPSPLANSTPENPKMVRLLMRQDSTLRVILNTAMAANMGFQVKESLKTKSVLFTAVEGEDAKLVQVQMKMSPQSADVFLKAVDGVKKKMNKESS